MACTIRAGFSSRGSYNIRRRIGNFRQLGRPRKPSASDLFIDGIRLKFQPYIPTQAPRSFEEDADIEGRSIRDDIVHVGFSGTRVNAVARKRACTVSTYLKWAKPRHPKTCAWRSN